MLSRFIEQLSEQESLKLLGKIILTAQKPMRISKKMTCMYLCGDNVLEFIDGDNLSLEDLTSSQKRKLCEILQQEKTSSIVDKELLQDLKKILTSFILEEKYPTYPHGVILDYLYENYEFDLETLERFNRNVNKVIKDRYPQFFEDMSFYLNSTLYSLYNHPKIMKSL